MSTDRTDRQRQEKQKPDAVIAIAPPPFEWSKFDVDKLDTQTEPATRLLMAIVAAGCASFRHVGPHKWIAGDDWLSFRYERLAALSKIERKQLPTLLAYLHTAGYIRLEVSGLNNDSVYIRLNLGADAKVA